MEYQAHDARCLLWWHPVESAEPRLGHTCAVVHGAELVELNSTEAEALTLAKLNSTEAEAEASASSDPSTTADQEFGELGSTSAKAEAEASASSDPSTTVYQNLGELGSTSSEAETGIIAIIADTTADQGFWSWLAAWRWAFAGAALCAAVAACAP